jgi:hypothetical protein
MIQKLSRDHHNENPFVTMVRLKKACQVCSKPVMMTDLFYYEDAVQFELVCSTKLWY